MTEELHTSALGLVARWVIDDRVAPVSPDERNAVAGLRFAQAIRLPPDERAALMRLLDNQDPIAGGDDRQEGSPPWFH